MHLSRRRFTRLAAATALLPRAYAQPAAKRVRYAVVGLGRISINQFMPGCKQSALSEVTALVSGHPDKAKKYAALYNVPEASLYTYETFDRIKDNPNIDAVYIALPNGMHAEYSIRALEAGKHVLCEKPMCNSVAEGEAMVNAATQFKRKLMIGYRVHLEPTALHARQLVQSGALGKIEAVESAFGFNIAPGEWRVNRKLAGGGPMMDVGIYALNTTRFMLNEEPTVLTAYSSVIDHDGRFNEVEENLAWTMRFPSGIVAACNTTYGANMPGNYRIHGSKGTIQVENAFSYQDVHLTGRAGSQNIDDLEQEKDPAQFAREADYFSRCILADAPVGPSGEEGLRDIRLIQRIYTSAGLKMG